jgi:hypothetical protein
MAQFLSRSDWSIAASGGARMKLNGTVLDRMVIYRDNIPGIEDFRNLKSQAPRQKNGGQANFKKIPNFNIQ